MADRGRKLFGRSGMESIARAEVEEMDGQIRDLNFLWTGKRVAGVIPRLAKFPFYIGDIKYIQRMRNLIINGIR